MTRAALAVDTPDPIGTLAPAPNGIARSGRLPHAPKLKRILHVVRGLTNSSGTTHIVSALSEEQARLGFDVTTMFVEKDGLPAVTPPDHLVRSKGFPMSLPLRNPGVSFAFAREMARTIGNFDVVHVHAIWNFPTFYTMREARRKKVPYVVAPQGSLEPWALRQNSFGKAIYGRLTEIPLLNKASCLQAVSAAEAKQLRDFGLHAEIAVIPNGVNEKAFDFGRIPPSTQLGLPPNKRTILFLSRLHPKKGVDVLIQAFSQMPSRGDTTLVIAGGDAGSGYADRLQQLAAECGCSDGCVFLGEVQGERKLAALKGADIFVLPSHSEGLPVAALEAMAASLPVVITPGCNLPEVEEWTAGLIAAPEPASIASALDELLANPDKAREMGANARELAIAQFTWAAIAKRTIALYETCLEKAPQ